MSDYPAWFWLTLAVIYAVTFLGAIYLSSRR